jgi:hypothetical protein
MIIDAYMDESGTHGTAAMMTIGGLVGGPNNWLYFNRRWKKMLKRRDAPYFHTKSLLDSPKPFKNWTLAQKESLINRGGDIIHRHTMFGFSIMLRQSDYDTSYKAGERLEKASWTPCTGYVFGGWLSGFPLCLRAVSAKNLSR